MLAGVNVMRLNFSHGERHTHIQTIGRVRDIARRRRRHVAILQDLSGPKIRTGPLEDGRPITVRAGQPLAIELSDGPGGAGRITTGYEPLFHALQPGARLLLDDGRVELVVESVDRNRVQARVVDGGELGEHKGINAPNVPLPPVGLTTKDEADLRAGLAGGVDIVALSFVQSPADIARARSINAEAGRPRVPIVAKLERPEAIERLGEIAAVADALMVARGDLGLELPLEVVPRVQKDVLRVGAERGVPVIVATQVLESMRSEPRPTRAEVSDAAGAVDSCAAAIMLSGETAVGAHPVRTVEVLNAIITHAEAGPPLFARIAPPRDHSDHLAALCEAAVTLSSQSDANAIVALTRQGRTARLLSACHPGVPVYAATNDEEVARRLCLWRSVEPVTDPLDGDADAVAARVVNALRANRALPQPATVVIVSASPDIARTGVNFVAVRRL